MIKQKKMTPSEIAAEDKVNEMMSRKPQDFEEPSPSKSDHDEPS